MRVRESGMPDAATWEAFFDAAAILDALGLTDPEADVIDFGCGYGTFTVAAASRTKGTVRALDIDAGMVESTMVRARAQGLRNVRAAQRDFVADGSGLADGTVDYALLFNILHGDDPAGLLREARRILRKPGKVAVIHWLHDPATPRGPELAIRPRPEQCRQWLHDAGFEIAVPECPLPPYHFGIVGAPGGE